jgi:hypothetical protein
MPRRMLAGEAAYSFGADEYDGITDERQYQIGYQSRKDFPTDLTADPPILPPKFQWQGVDYENFAYIQRQ